MTPYELLIDILDTLRSEAPGAYKSYHPEPGDTDKLNSARAKAFLHLFLKVRFGLLSFAEREEYITEGGYDGGVDAYYIDSERKTIYFLQAKFRTNEKNFEEKAIDPEELLMMDISRILEGETKSEAGIDYNPKILRMAKRIKEISDIGRYNYTVVILANAKGVTRQKLVLLTSGLPAELIDHKACYTKLLFPLITGTYYQAEQLQLSLSLSNKSAGAKISYTVNTEFTKCEITVIFVPTLEIAKAMFKYRNSILQYNPRSYLGHEGKAVNSEIRRSIEEKATNEFALFNNGITILSDETYLNERIGQKDRAQLILINPQIINGGQTAYTLSVIYRENLDKDFYQIFGEKEVLVKIITFEGGEGLSEKKKLELIENISRATNQQTTVTIADRRSNEQSVQKLQKQLFDRTGLFMERKRGEFEDGIREGYIRPSEIIDRTTFFRAAMTIQGKFEMALRKRLVAKAKYEGLVNVPEETIDRFGFAIQLLSKMIHRDKERPEGISIHLLAKLYFGVQIGFKSDLTLQERAQEVDKIAQDINSTWVEFKSFASNSYPKFDLTKRGHKKFARDLENYLNSPTFLLDVSNFLAKPREINQPHQ